jgi:uncharacterized Zn finger protein
MAIQSIAPTATVDHVVLDTIMCRLEQRYGLDPRLDRAFRLYMAGRVEIFADEPTTALVHGESGNSYHATINGFCECPDAANGYCCKHQLATKIAVQMRAVEKAKDNPSTPPTDDSDRAYLVRLCSERQQLGARLLAQGIRPVDDGLWNEYGEWIARLRTTIAAR